MKKLLDELETALNSDAVQWCNHEYSDGFKCALEIVRAHNPWHEVTELPPMDEELEFSHEYPMDVLLTDGVNCVVGYYDGDFGKWISDGYEHTFTHWKYLEELPK